MIIGKIHKGSGLGDQLFSYITVRSLAERRDVDFGFVGVENFKGDFIDLDWGKQIDFKYHTEPQTGELVIDDEHRLFRVATTYDPEINFIDDMVVDATNGQDTKYWDINKVREWLRVEPLEMGNICVVNFRGGEYAGVPDLFLPPKYWLDATNRMLEINPDVSFEVHTDDKEMASRFFRNLPIIQDININWRSLLFAKYAIVSNSAFAILPRLLNGGLTIAPRYWAGYNVKEWRRPQNYYPQFTYI